MKFAEIKIGDKISKTNGFWKILEVDYEYYTRDRVFAGDGRRFVPEDILVGDVYCFKVKAELICTSAGKLKKKKHIRVIWLWANTFTAVEDYFTAEESRLEKINLAIANS
jgi:hypothetical protein